MDFMQRLERRSTMMTEGAQRSAAVTTALRPLWDTFSEDQKRIAPRLMREAVNQRRPALARARRAPRPWPDRHRMGMHGRDGPTAAPCTASSKPATAKRPPTGRPFRFPKSALRELARIELDHEVRFHLDRVRHFRQGRDARDAGRHLGVIDLDVVGHVALGELARHDARPRAASTCPSPRSRRPAFTW